METIFIKYFLSIKMLIQNTIINNYTLVNSLKSRIVKIFNQFFCVL
jgi:hypothetical protein